MLLLFLTLDEMNTTISVVKFQSLKKGKKFHWNFTHKFLEVSISFTKFHKVSIWHKLQSGDHWSRFCWLSRKKKCDKPLIEISKYRKCPWNFGWNFIKFCYKFHKVSTEISAKVSREISDLYIWSQNFFSTKIY